MLIYIKYATDYNAIVKQASKFCTIVSGDMDFRPVKGQTAIFVSNQTWCCQASHVG